MSLEEFARHVGLDAREVRKLAERGKLPAQKVAGVWRFNRARVTEWLQQEMLTSDIDEPRLRAIEKAMADADRAEDHNCLISSLIRIEGIDLHLPARTKSSVLLELVQLADRTGLLWDQPGFLRALQERESLCSTALPNGIAIPHPRQPMPYVSSEPFICLARLGRGIGFGSPYGGLTDVFFLICCHDDRSHLHVLARLMRILDDATMKEVRELDSAQAVLDTLVARERAVAERCK